DGVTQGPGFRRFLPGGGQHVVDPLIVVGTAVLVVDSRRIAVPDHVALDPLAVTLRVGVEAPPRPRAAHAVDPGAADHVLPAHEAEVNSPAVVQPLHDVVDRVVRDLVLARVRKALDALERQRVVTDLLPAELEAAPLLATEFPEVIDRA